MNFGLLSVRDISRRLRSDQNDLVLVCDLDDTLSDESAVVDVIEFAARYYGGISDSEVLSLMRKVAPSVLEEAKDRFLRKHPEIAWLVDDAHIGAREMLVVSPVAKVFKTHPNYRNAMLKLVGASHEFRRTVWSMLLNECGLSDNLTFEDELQAFGVENRQRLPVPRHWSEHLLSKLQDAPLWRIRYQDDFVREIPGAIKALEWIKDEHIKFAILSNGSVLTQPMKVDGLLVQAGYSKRQRERFIHEKCVFSGNIGVSKPDPVGMVAAAAAALNMRQAVPSQVIDALRGKYVVMVGDNAARDGLALLNFTNMAGECAPNNGIQTAYIHIDRSKEGLVSVPDGQRHALARLTCSTADMSSVPSALQVPTLNRGLNWGC